MRTNAFEPVAVGEDVSTFTRISIHGGDTLDASRRHLTKACGCKWTDDRGWSLCEWHFGYEQAVDDVLSHYGNDDLEGVWDE